MPSTVNFFNKSAFFIHTPVAYFQNESALLKSENENEYLMGWGVFAILNSCEIFPIEKCRMMPVNSASKL